MRRGFKTEANVLAREVRDELSLSHHSPLDAWRLAKLLGIPVVPLSDCREAAPDATRFFLNGGQELFSGVTVFDGPRRMIVINDAHVRGRQASDLANEISHGLLQHAPSVALDERGCRVWDREKEAEADWLGGALLVPEEAAMRIVSLGWSDREAAARYGVTPTMIRYRLNVTGARKRVQRLRRH